MAKKKKLKCRYCKGTGKWGEVVRHEVRRYDGVVLERLTDPAACPFCLGKHIRIGKRLYVRMW